MKTQIIIKSFLITCFISVCLIGCSEKDEVTPSNTENQKVNQIDTPFKNDKTGGGDDDPRPIKGKVVNNGGSGLENTVVTLYTLGLQFVDNDTSGSQGNYQMDSISPDTYKLYFTKQGYQQLIKTIVVEGSDPTFNLGTDTLQTE